MTLTRWTRPLRHPGPVATERRTSVATSSTAARVLLPAGLTLVDASAAALEQLGATSGQVELLDGTLSRVSYCFPALCTDGATAVTYSERHEAQVPARVAAGSATVGFRHGERFAHCHATWFDAGGNLFGGHLWPETVIGPGGVHALVHALDRVELISDTDPESRMPVFTPHEQPIRAVAATGAVRAVMTRVAPGVELGEVVRDIMREHGFAKASIAGSLGSLSGAVLQRGGSVLVVDGPATEVTLTGTFDLAAEADACPVSAMVIDRFGVVHHGLLVAEENIVAVTLELLVEEVAS
ncbi:MAG: hypothetical protein JWO46_952 [Nocardioidaceae bacterium]|nr:hypothetical protein [Nocardioidaceae bacterium]